MEVQKYLAKHGLDKLQEELSIVVTDYPDRVVLNYNQIESPRFNPIADECRALILRKSDWSVLARSFNRFYNWGEGVPHGAESTYQRVAQIDATVIEEFRLVDAVVQEKLDGSIISVAHDGNDWQVSTRKMAFAEGQTNLGRTFAEVFWAIANKHDLKNKMDQVGGDGLKSHTLVFELTGPENRVVTPYDEPNITLIGGRYNVDDMQELSPTELDNLASGWDVSRPKIYEIDNATNLLKLVHDFPSMEEGVVLLIQRWGSHWRVKVKNPKFVAIANMRSNGDISPRRILLLVMENEHHEYLKYFSIDKPYFSFVEDELHQSIKSMEDVYGKSKNISSQKDFAFYIKECLPEAWMSGILFQAKKYGKSIKEVVLIMDSKKLAINLCLKEKMRNQFIDTNYEDE